MAMVPPIRSSLIAFVMIAAVASAGAAGIEFGSRIPFGFNHGYRFRVADFNGDGRRDIIINNYYEPVFSWLERTATVDPIYIPHDIRLPYTYDSAFDVGDIDKDGDLDIVSSSYISSQIGVVWWENKGGSNPAVVPHVVAASQPAIRDILVADVDRDGDLDVVATSIGPVIYWYENSGVSVPTFTARLIYQEPTANNDPQNVCAADFDGDGDLDLVTSCHSVDGGFIWYENKGGKPVSWARRILPSGIVVGYGLAVCDLDGDGDTDILGTGSSSAFWLQNSGGANPTFTNRTISASGSLNSPDCIVTGDLNMDGRPDILINDPDWDRIYYYLNDGAATPSFVRYSFGSDRDPAWMGVEDLDGDGDQDVIQLSADNSIDLSWFRNQFAWNEALPSVTPDTGMSTGINEGEITSVTMNFFVQNRSRDLKLSWSAAVDAPWLQVVPSEGTTDPGTSTTVKVSFTQSVSQLRSGTHHQTLAVKGSDPNVTVTERTIELVVISRKLALLQPHLGVATGVDSYTYRMDVCDLNGDGWDDVISASWQDGVSWLRRDPSKPSGFSTRKYPLGLTYNERVSAGDLDHDGDLDLVTYGWISSTPKLVWLENDGKADPDLTIHEIDTQTRLMDFVVADMDGDNVPDIVATTPDSMKWYKNNGTHPPVFTSQAMLGQIPTEYVFMVECADVDGDGDSDAVTWNLLQKELAWVENRNKAASFAAHTISTQNDYVCLEFKISDFDCDGDPDVVAVFADRANMDGRPGKVVWFENIRSGGTSTFVEHVIDQTIIDPDQFCVADMDNDKYPDLFVGTGYQPGGNDVFYIENRKGIVPQFAVNYFRNVYRPRAFVSADFDHNGTIDMIMMPLGQYDFFENPRQNSAGDWLNYR